MTVHVRIEARPSFSRLYAPVRRGSRVSRNLITTRAAEPTVMRVPQPRGLMNICVLRSSPLLCSPPPHRGGLVRNGSWSSPKPAVVARSSGLTHTTVASYGRSESVTQSAGPSQTAPRPHPDQSRSVLSQCQYRSLCIFGSLGWHGQGSGRTILQPGFALGSVPGNLALHTLPRHAH